MSYKKIAILLFAIPILGFLAIYIYTIMLL